MENENKTNIINIISVYLYERTKIQTMKQLKHYIQRFLSKTPKALVKLQALLVGVSVPITAALAVMQQYDVDMPKLFKTLTTALIVIPFMIFAIQFSTTNKTLQEHGGEKG